MRSYQLRLAGLFMAIVLGDFFFLQVRSDWRNYWLRTDPQQGMATIMKKYWGGHGNYVYQYSVNLKQYAGRSQRNWRDPQYSNVLPGDQAVVFYSASHPWLSQLYKPDTVIQGLPVLVIAFLIELIAIVTIIRPNSKWAFDAGDKKGKNNVA